MTDSRIPTVRNEIVLDTLAAEKALQDLEIAEPVLELFP